MKTRSRPLGVDLGTCRLRVVHTVEDSDGPRVNALSARDVGDGMIRAGTIEDVGYVSALLEEAVRELNVRERRCVIALGQPAAFLRLIALPPMTWYERERTARFEAGRFVHDLLAHVVRIRPIDRGSRWLLGAVRKDSLDLAAQCVKRAGLRLVAVDDEGCALRRAFPNADVIVDIGLARAALHIGGSYDSFSIKSGGAHVTAALSRDLGIDERSAEKRKRIIGTAGAGEHSRGELVSAIAEALCDAREHHAVQSAVFVGNGSRLASLLEDIERAAGVTCQGAASSVLYSRAYPNDVMRSSAPDVSLAASLAQWGAA